MPIRLDSKTLAILLDNSVRNDSGCLVWQRAVRNGYGTIKRAGKNRTTHRVAYELLVGEIPAGIHVLHKCDNPRCINVDHLFLGTNADNIADKLAKGRSGKKLDVESVKEIKTMLDRKYTHRYLANLYRVNPCSISRIATSKRWAHVEAQSMTSIVVSPSPGP